MSISVERDKKKKVHIRWVDDTHQVQGWTIKRIKLTEYEYMYQVWHESGNASFESANWNLVRKGIQTFTKQLELF